MTKIDFHTHYFPDSIAPKVIPSLANKSSTMPFTDGTLSGLVTSMKAADMNYSVTLPVVTAPSQTTSINDKVLHYREELQAQGIIPFGGLHPDFEDYKTELRRLKNGGIRGIKLHPAYQNTDLNDIRYLRIIAEASALDLVCLIHAGIDIGVYDHNYSSVPHVLQVLKEVAPEKFVLAHMGGFACWDEVERDLAGANVYLDSAFSIGPIVPYPDVTPSPYASSILSDEGFLRLTRKHGIGRVLFATDSPWQDQKKYVKRFEHIGLTKEEQALFFGKNAETLLGI